MERRSSSVGLVIIALLMLACPVSQSAPVAEVGSQILRTFAIKAGGGQSVIVVPTELPISKFLIALNSADINFTQTTNWIHSSTAYVNVTTEMVENLNKTHYHRPRVPNWDASKPLPVYALITFVIMMVLFVCSLSGLAYVFEYRKNQAEKQESGVVHGEVLAFKSEVMTEVVKKTEHVLQPPTAFFMTPLLLEVMQNNVNNGFFDDRITAKGFKSISPSDLKAMKSDSRVEDAHNSL